MNSSKTRSLQHWFEDILKWGERLGSYIEGLDEASFSIETKTQDAVIRCIECIGEAATQIIANKNALPDSWLSPMLEEAKWTRNRLIHGYFDINISVIWQTATVSIPQLVLFVRGLSDDFSDE